MVPGYVLQRRGNCTTQEGDFQSETHSLEMVPGRGEIIPFGSQETDRSLSYGSTELNISGAKQPRSSCMFYSQPGARIPHSFRSDLYSLR
jgi:hypothetical protein